MGEKANVGDSASARRSDGMTTVMQYEDVLQFWFSELKPAQWWKKDAELDRKIAERFGSTHAAASRAELFHWRATGEGRLAEILVLDQFSRQIYRNRPQAFACDTLALALAQEAVSRGVDDALTLSQRNFLYMPYMHSESAVIHKEAVRVFSKAGEQQYDFELRHKAVIDRFGRYPHRNTILGRRSTPQEVEFLKMPSSSGF